jgi:hypothetical protein
MVLVLLFPLKKDQNNRKCGSVHLKVFASQRLKLKIFIWDIGQEKSIIYSFF